VSSFETVRNRDAYPTIRGFRYQVDQTILRWIELSENEILELERGEDIDLIVGIVGDVEEAGRRLEQVKHLTRSITLKSSASIQAIANAIEHRDGNPELELKFRFCTNAKPTVERPSPFRPRRAGIDVWQAVRAPLGDADPSAVGAIHKILREAARPDGCPDNCWAGFQRFLAATDDKLVGLIRDFDWGVSQPDAEDLESIVVDNIVSSGFAKTIREARRLYRLLFLAVFKRLSQAGLKRLTRLELTHHSRSDELPPGDVALLQRLEDRIFSLEQRMTNVETAIDQQRSEIVEIIAARKQLESNVFVDFGAIEVEPPASVDRAAIRSITAEKLVDLLRSVTWFAMHGGVGSGKTELAKLIIRAGAFAPCLFIPLRDRSSAEAEVIVLRALGQYVGGSPISLMNRLTLIRMAANRLKSAGLLVLDDLPQLLPGDSLSRLIIELCRARSHDGPHILTTSYHPPPTSVIDQLKEESRIVQPVPPFNQEEVLELFAAWGAPKDGVNPEIARLINLWASGQPTSIAATANYLSQHEWKFDRQELEVLLRGHHPAGPSEEGLRRLVATVRDATDRRLLYRLCLIYGSFPPEQVLLVAQAFEPLDRPRERLLSLTGPWIQPAVGHNLLVSPLVRPLANTELSREERFAVNGALASEIVARPTKSVFDVAMAVGYFVAAEAYERACAFLVVAFHSALDLPDDQVRLLLGMSWYDRPLPPEMALDNRLYLRSFQLRACERVGLPTHTLFVECDGLMAASTDRDAWAVFAFTVQTLRMRAQTDFPVAMRDLQRALAAYPSLVGKGGRLYEMPGDLKPAMLLWQIVTEIKSPAQLHMWLDAVESFNAGDLKAAFTGVAIDYQGAQIATDSVWMEEHVKPERNKNWGAVNAVLERAQRVGERLSLEPLFAAAVRSRIVVLADYLKDLGAADSLAKTATAIAQSGEAQLLIDESIGRQFFIQKQYSDAVAWPSVRIDCELWWNCPASIFG
jgi:hypothetical protein